MEKFERRFDVCLLETKLSSCPILTELFRLWRLSGQSDERTDCRSLRLAVRKGYLNLYVGGQSVAKIRAGQSSGVQLTLHEKYYQGWEKGSSQAANCGDKERTLHAANLASSDAAAIVGRWVATAATYCGAEKLFVDSLVARNANVVDLEMGLPGDERLLSKIPEHCRHRGAGASTSAQDDRKSAPRMDLATVVKDSDGVACLNFWEAKCANNGELRAKKNIDFVSGTGACAAHQLRRYVDWLNIDGREQEVAEAFRNAARVLLDLARLFEKDLDSEACGHWELLVKQRPRVVRRPGIVIGNYDPRRKRDGERDRMAHRATSFDCHRKRLAAVGISVVEVASANDAHAILERLPDGPISAMGHSLM